MTPPPPPHPSVFRSRYISCGVPSPRRPPPMHFMSDVRSFWSYLKFDYFFSSCLSSALLGLPAVVVVVWLLLVLLLLLSLLSLSLSSLLLLLLLVVSSFCSVAIVVVAARCVVAVPLIVSVLPDGLRCLLIPLDVSPNEKVVANAVAALSEIGDTSGRDVMEIDTSVLQKLLAALNECTEWGQVGCAVWIW